MIVVYRANRKNSVNVGVFLLGSIPEPYPLYLGIRSSPAGASLWIDRADQGGLRLWFNLTTSLAEAEAAPFDRDAL